jgi:hypothetical protein
MKSKRLFTAIGNIDDRFIDEDAEDKIRRKTHEKKRTAARFSWLKLATPLAACLIIAVAIFGFPTLFENPIVPSTVLPAADGNGGMGDGNNGFKTVTNNTAIGKPSLTIEEGVNIGACYADPNGWRGLETGSFLLQEQTDSSVEANRIVFQTLQDLADYAYAFVVVPGVREVAPDGENMQTSIAEYAETIGDVIQTSQWDDYTISTGSRILIRQTLIGGYSMNEPNNLLRVGGIYLLPVRFDDYLGAYEVVGDLDVLFELSSEGRIVSHSRFSELNKYDGKSFSELLNDVRAIYAMPETEFSEQPIDSLEQAERQIDTAYNNSGYRKFAAVFEKETVISGADVYLFKVTFGESGNSGSEYGAIAKLNGAFIRGVINTYGEFLIRGGLGGFPKNSR